MRCRAGLVLFVLTLIIGVGCRKPLAPNVDRNEPPETWITGAPQDTITEKDPDGTAHAPKAGTLPVRSEPMSRTATCVWRIGASLVLALDEHLGPPVDSYVNGTQTWLTDDGPGGATLEWRLHPVARYRTPEGLSHYDLWEQVVAALTAEHDPDALELGSERLNSRRSN